MKQRWTMLLVFVAAACQKPPAMNFQRPPANVKVASVVTQDVPVYIDAIGKCWPREMVAIRPQVSGRITEIHFKDGADVKKGDLLFTIDPRPYQAKLNADQAMVAQAKAKLGLAESDWKRMESISDPRAISKQDLDQRKNAVQVAEAELRHSEAEVETSKLNLEYCSIFSPIDGRTGQRLIDLGNVVSPTSDSLVSIQRLDPIYADFTIPENNLSAVQKQLEKGTLKTEVQIPDEPDSLRNGELSFLDNMVQEGTGTIKLRATLPNTDRRFWPGRFVRIRIILDQLSGAMLVPGSAIQVSAKGSFVYVIKADSTVEFRPITPGQKQGDQVVISQGLVAGERVVVQGQVAIYPGAKVTVQP